MSHSRTTVRFFLTAIAVAGFFCSTSKENTTPPRVSSTSVDNHALPPAAGKEDEDIYGDSGKPQLCDIISGKEVDHYIYADYDGRRIYFHCIVCRDTFQQKAPVYLKAIKKRGIVLGKILSPNSKVTDVDIFGEHGHDQIVDVISGKPINPEVFGDYFGKRIYFCCMVSKSNFEQNKRLYFQAMKKRGILLEDSPKKR